MHCRGWKRKRVLGLLSPALCGLLYFVFKFIVRDRADQFVVRSFLALRFPTTPDANRFLERVAVPFDCFCLNKAKKKDRFGMITVTPSPLRTRVNRKRQNRRTIFGLEIDIRIRSICQLPSKAFLGCFLCVHGLAPYFKQLSAFMEIKIRHTHATGRRCW